MSEPPGWDDRTCGEVLSWRGEPRACVMDRESHAMRGWCECWLAHGHTGHHECEHGWEWQLHEKEQA